jgi:hypothetical protein
MQHRFKIGEPAEVKVCDLHLKSHDPLLPLAGNH